MTKLALTIPGLSGNSATVNQIPGVKYSGSTPNLLTTILSDGIRIAFLIAGFLMLIWLVWGAFQYIFAGGDKAAIAKARSRMTWAIVGFLILMISFAVSEWAKTIIPSQPVTPPTLTVPVNRTQ